MRRHREEPIEIAVDVEGGRCLVKTGPETGHVADLLADGVRRALRSFSCAEAIRWSACGWVSRTKVTVKSCSATSESTWSMLPAAVRQLFWSKFPTASISAARRVAVQAATDCTEPVSGS